MDISLIIIILIVFLAVTIFCLYCIFKNPKTSLMFRWTTILSSLAVSGFAYLYTFNFVYSLNSNTRIHGWPVPLVILQRDAPGEPWLDYIGNTLFFGFPINLLIFLGSWLLIIWIFNIFIIRTNKQKMI